MRRAAKEIEIQETEPRLDRAAALERKKSTKLAMIRAAAREAFAEKGFDAATMQEIARRARVAIGTLFLYADNKRDIAFLAVLEDFDRAREIGAALPVSLPIVEQFAGIFGEYYKLHHQSPAMARIILSEFLFFNVGKHAQLHAAGVQALKAELARRAALAVERGELQPAAVPSEVADLAYFVFQGTVRQWVRSGALNLDDGLAAFRHMMALALTGVSRREAPPAPFTRGRRHAGGVSSKP